DALQRGGSPRLDLEPGVRSTLRALLRGAGPVGEGGANPSNGPEPEPRTASRGTLRLHRLSLRSSSPHDEGKRSSVPEHSARGPTTATAGHRAPACTACTRLPPARDPRWKRPSC